MEVARWQPPTLLWVGRGAMSAKDSSSSCSVAFHDTQRRGFFASFAAQKTKRNGGSAAWRRQHSAAGASDGPRAGAAPPLRSEYVKAGSVVQCAEHGRACGEAQAEKPSSVLTPIPLQVRARAEELKRSVEAIIQGLQFAADRVQWCAPPPLLPVLSLPLPHCRHCAAALPCTRPAPLRCLVHCLTDKLCSLRCTS